MYRELLKQGHTINQKTVEKYMRAADVQAKTHRKFRVSTTDSNHPHPIAPNVVSCNFKPSGKNETWTADIMYIPTDDRLAPGSATLNAPVGPHSGTVTQNAR